MSMFFSQLLVGTCLSAQYHLCSCSVNTKKHPKLELGSTLIHRKFSLVPLDIDFVLIIRDIIPMIRVLVQDK